MTTLQIVTILASLTSMAISAWSVRQALLLRAIRKDYEAKIPQWVFSPSVQGRASRSHDRHG